MQSPFNPFVFRRRFFPLFCVQFFGAFNDNVFKNAMVMLITFQLAGSATEAGILITLAAGIFILPFLLFSALAGEIADRYDKTRLIRKIKLAEILIMATGAVALWMQDLILLFAVLFFMGLQSTFFGPIKYAILPEHLEADELLHGNGWFSASTFVSILLGTLLGGLVVLLESGTEWMALLVLALSLLGYVASRFVPPSHAGSDIQIHGNFIKSTWLEISESRRYPQAFFAVLAISWFWFLGASYLSQMPVIVKDWVFGDDKVVLAFLTSFSVGIALGAWLIGKSGIRVRDASQLSWMSGLLIGMSLLMLVSNLLLAWMPSHPQIYSLSHFFVQPIALAVMACLLLIATLGGVFIVPLYTLLQVQTPQGHRSRLVAVNNITNALFMVASSLMIMGFYAFDQHLITIFSVIAVINLGVAWWFWRQSRSWQPSSNN